MKAKTIAGQLAEAFGDVAKMVSMYAENVEWTLPASLPFDRPIKGKKAVEELNSGIWQLYYYPDCSVDILDEMGGEASSAVRFSYKVRSRVTETLYENEYTLFVRSDSNGITEVFEGMDTGFVLDFMNGRERGASFQNLARHI